MMTDDDFRSLYDKHYTDVLRFVRSFVRRERDVKEIVQDVFVQVARHHAEYRGAAHIRTWLFAIAKNAVTDYWRKQQRLKNRPVLQLDESTENLYAAGAGNEPESSTLHKDEMTRIRRCIDTLPEQMRLVMLCRSIHGMDTAETAYILHWSTTRVRVTYSRALKRFRRMWTESNTTSVSEDATG